MDRKGMNTCLISGSRKMQIRATARYHLSLVRKAILKNTKNSKHQQECGEGNPVTLRLRMQAGTAIMQNSREGGSTKN